MRRAAVLVGLTAAFVAPAYAERSDVRFPVPGNYGDADGCKRVMDRQTSSDAMLYLTPEYVGTYATLCQPLAIWPAGEDTVVAPVICGHEGDETQTVDHVRLVKAPAGRDAYLIFGADGTPWGEVMRCD